jgi:hypothetical protein
LGSFFQIGPLAQVWFAHCKLRFDLEIQPHSPADTRFPRRFGFVFSNRPRQPIWVRIVNGTSVLEAGDIRPTATGFPYRFGFVFSNRLAAQTWARIRWPERAWSPAVLGSFFEAGPATKFGFVS